MDMNALRRGTALLLAGGDAHRFPADQPAAVQPLGGTPILFHLLDTLESLSLQRIVVISQLRHLEGEVKGRARFIYQSATQGSGQALLNAREQIERGSGPVLVVYVNHPFILADSLRMLITEHEKTGAACTFLSIQLDKPHGHARVIRDTDGSILRMSRDCEAAPAELNIKEVIAGAYCFKRQPLLDAMEALKGHGPALYLTQLITQIAAQESVVGIPLKEAWQARGVYSPADLAAAETSLVR